MAPVSDERENPLATWSDTGGDAIGVPSTGLSLGWLLASRANLRFTRRGSDTQSRSEKQEESKMPVTKTCMGVAKEGLFFV